MAKKQEIGMKFLIIQKLIVKSFYWEIHF